MARETSKNIERERGMKYILMHDFGSMPKGTIIDGRDKIEFLILTDENFYKANPKQFQSLPEMEEAER